MHRESWDGTLMIGDAGSLLDKSHTVVRGGTQMDRCST